MPPPARQEVRAAAKNAVGQEDNDGDQQQAEPEIPILRIHVGDLFEESRIRPESAGRGLVRIRQLGLGEFLGGRILLMLGIHQLAVGLRIPPGVAEIFIQNIGAGVNVADHALTGRHGRDELVIDRVPALVLGDRWIGILGQPQMAELRVWPGTCSTCNTRPPRSIDEPGLTHSVTLNEGGASPSIMPRYS